MWNLLHISQKSSTFVPEMVYQDIHSALEERMKRYEQVCVIADEAVYLDIPA